MKKCNKCNKTKPLEDFPKNSTKKDGRGYSCKSCHNQYTKNHYRQNKEQYLTKNSKTNERNKEFSRKLRALSGCSICSEKRWWVLQYHHKKDKEYNIAELVRRSCSLQTLKKELKKCIIVCANCHLDIHHKPL